MGQPVVVVAGDQADTGTDAAAAFAAGAAAVTAAQAAETAETSAELAAAAVLQADVAQESAAAAEGAAFDAQAAVAALEARFERAMDEIVEALNNPAEEAITEDPTAPEVVVDAVHVEAPAEAITTEPAADKPRRRRDRGSWGSDAWFGQRR